MALDLETLLSSIQPYVESKAGVLTIFAEQGGTRPTPPFVTMNPTLVGKVGMNEDLPPDSTGLADSRREWVINLSIQGFGKNSFNRMIELAGWFDSFEGCQTLCNAGISILSVSDILNVTESLEVSFEERAVFEVVTTAGAIDSVNVGVVEKVGIVSGSLRNNDDSEADNIQVIIGD